MLVGIVAHWGNRPVSLLLMLGLLGIFVAIGGCVDEERDKAKAEAEQLRQKVAAQETQIKQQQDQLADAQKGQSHWSMLAMVAFCGLVVGVVVALVAGAAMGSRTRHDAKLQKNEAPANVEVKP